jgi:serine/threonine-protein kinase
MVSTAQPEPRGIGTSLANGAAWSQESDDGSKLSGLRIRENEGPRRARRGARLVGDTYRIVRYLDEGGTGAVFEAEDLSQLTPVAVKLLAPELASNPDAVARFRGEAEILSRLEHPHIVKVLDFDVVDATIPYLVLELLRGETLAERLRRRGAFRLPEAVGIVVQIASALAAAHEAGIVHRDVKPANVFLTDAAGEPPCAKLLDFGIAKDMRTPRPLTETRTLVGTPAYMAPEQTHVTEAGVDARTDQYALAVVAYEMLTGEQPFSHDDLAEVLRRVTALTAPPASSVARGVPIEVDGVLARALSKAPEARFDGVEEFARSFAEASRAAVSPCSTPTRFGARRRSPTIDRTMPSSVAPASAASGRIAPVRVTKRSAVAPSVSGVLAVSEDRGNLDPVEPDQALGSLPRINACLEQARAAFTAGAFADATLHAEAALRIGDDASEELALAVLRASEPLLARIFTCQLGSLGRRALRRGKCAVRKGIHSAEGSWIPAEWALTANHVLFSSEDARRWSRER